MNSCRSLGAEQFSHRFTAVGDRDGAIASVQLVARIDAESTVDRRVQVGHGDRTRLNFHAEFVRLADRHAVLQTASSQHDAETLRVMSSPAAASELRGAAE